MFSKELNDDVHSISLVYPHTHLNCSWAKLLQFISSLILRSYHVALSWSVHSPDHNSADLLHSPVSPFSLYTSYIQNSLLIAHNLAHDYFSCMNSLPYCDSICLLTSSTAHELQTTLTCLHGIPISCGSAYNIHSIFSKQIWRNDKWLKFNLIMPIFLEKVQGNKVMHFPPHIC